MLVNFDDDDDENARVKRSTVDFLISLDNDEYIRDVRRLLQSDWLASITCRPSFH